ncbi:MAG: AzlD domain-containing protein [Spirochaetaceae bacterium]|jgi:branched-subunit amino acid transport protein AzlD|nr:AzlD domain-containing protein [Spirochaetaceae bacterium]
MLNLHDAFVYTFIMALTVFACRSFAFIVFKNANSIKKDILPEQFIRFVERTAPPVTMTCLTCNALTADIRAAASGADVFLIAQTAFAALLTTALHVWKRNAFISIGGGTALYVFFPVLREMLQIPPAYP